MKKPGLILYAILVCVISLTFLSIVVFGVYKDISPLEATQEKIKLTSSLASLITAIVGIYAFKWLYDVSHPMKEGDTVRMSSKNPNHLGVGVCAYSQMEGTVVQTWEDGSFCINTGTSELIVPLTRKKGVWIFLNGKHIYHKRK